MKEFVGWLISYSPPKPEEKKVRPVSRPVPRGGPQTQTLESLDGDLIERIKMSIDEDFPLEEEVEE